MNYESMTAAMSAKSDQQLSAARDWFRSAGGAGLYAVWKRTTEATDDPVEREVRNLARVAFDLLTVEAMQRVAKGVDE